MRKPEIAERIARQTGLTKGEAADRLDGLVSEVISRLRQGKDAELPGLGRFSSGSGGAVRFQRQRRPADDR